MKQKRKIATCKECGETREHYAFGLCQRCYIIEYRKNPEHYRKILASNKKSYHKKVNSGRCQKCGRELTFGDTKTRCAEHTEMNNNLAFYGSYMTRNEMRVKE